MEQERKIKVLVLGVGGNVSQGIIKALKNSDLRMELIGACISVDSLGLYLCDRAYISPYAKESCFLPWLIDLCNKEAIDIVLTGVEENICAIQKNIDKFNSSTDAVFITSAYEKLMVGQDKYKTCEWLKNHGCHYPKFCKLEDSDAVYELIEETGFPLIAKPRSGKGSIGVCRINSHQELREISDRNQYVLEEFIGDDEHEYTIGCYAKRDGTFVEPVIMRRRLVNGSTAIAEIVKNEKIYKEAVKICKEFQPRGPLNIQMRTGKDGRPVCFELNIRFSGTTPMRAHFGFRDVEAMVREYVLGQDCSDLFDIKEGKAYRYINELYLYSNASEKLEKTGYDPVINHKFMKIDTLGGRK